MLEYCLDFICSSGKLFGFLQESIMQKPVTHILKIIKEFVLEARIERALIIANIILLLIYSSKISLYQLGLGTNKEEFRLKICEQNIQIKY